MDAVSVLLSRLKNEPRLKNHFIGLLHILIGKRITAADDQMVSVGLTWRDLAAKLKKVRWQPEAVEELGLVEKELPPRDRGRYWYTAISRAKVESAAAIASAEKVAEILQELGYTIGAKGKKLNEE